MPFTMSPKEYAKHAGVTPQRISQMIMAGKLDGAWKLGPTGAKLIDPEKADAIRDFGRGLDKNPATANKPQVFAAPTEGSASGNKAPPMAESRAIREAYQARMAKLEYEEMTGKLVEAEKVKIKAFECARRVRDALLNIPDRVAAELANETSEHKIHGILTRELVQALEELANAGRT